LGYAGSSIEGLGSGMGFSKVIVDAIFDSIKLGIHSGYNGSKCASDSGFIVPVISV